MVVQIIRRIAHALFHYYQLMQRRPEDKCNGRIDEDKEPYEVDVIIDSDAVVDPGAVVVETFNAAVAGAAVTAARGTDDEAVWAELDWVDHLH